MSQYPIRSSALQKSVLALGILFSLSYSSSAQAVGLGLYVEYGRGIGSIDDREFDENRFGAGFALDTVVAGDRLFNYRLNVGYQRVDRDFDHSSSLNPDFNGLTINNMFGFGVYRDSNVRLWLGPSFRFNADFMTDVGSDDASVQDLGIGGGIALGVNLHTGDLGSAAFTFGYQYLYVGEVVGGNDVEATTFNGREHLISFNLSYFFRTPGDRYFLGRKR